MVARLEHLGGCAAQVINQRFQRPLALGWLLNSSRTFLTRTWCADGVMVCGVDASAEAIRIASGL